MSPVTGGATARRPTRGAPRPTRRAAPRPRLIVVPPPRPAPRRAPFVAIVLGLLVVGLGTLLVLNTVLAQGAFRMADLQQQVRLLADDEQALQQSVAELASPARLSRQARALGMVPMTTPVFLRMADGKVLGRARPATGAVPAWARAQAPVAQPAAPAKPASDGGDPASNQSGDRTTDQPDSDRQGQRNQQGNQPGNQGQSNQGAADGSGGQR